MCVRELSKKNCRVSRQDRVWQSADRQSNNATITNSEKINHEQELI